MDTNGSFYAGGLPFGTADGGLGNVPSVAPAGPANSSFYQSGTIYQTIAGGDALVAAVAASAAAATAASVASAASAAAAAASAASLNVTLLMTKAANLSDLANVATAKTNLSLVKGDVGLGSVDNTSDVGKPVSTAQATADALVASNAATATALKANIASPTFTGSPAAPTATPGDNTTLLATTAFVDAARVILSAATALKAPLASPGLTGVPTAPTAAPGTNTTQLATTAYADAIAALKADLASPTLTGVPLAPTASVGTNTTQLATTAFVLANRATLPFLTSSLGADVTMATNAVFDGPSVAQGTSGTWLVSGNVTVLDTSAAASITCKLWDGTTVIDSTLGITGGANLTLNVFLSGVITNPAGNLKISCSDSNGTPAGKIKFNTSGNSKDSTITAVRIG